MAAAARPQRCPSRRLLPLRRLLKWCTTQWCEVQLPAAPLLLLLLRGSKFASGGAAGGARGRADNVVGVRGSRRVNSGVKRCDVSFGVAVLALLLCLCCARGCTRSGRGAFYHVLPP